MNVLRTRRRRGASVVEFALVAPVLLLVVFAMVEFGRAIMVQQALTNAAREGARTASLRTTLTVLPVYGSVYRSLHGVFSASDGFSPVAVTVTPYDLSGVPSGTPIQVSLSVDARHVTWLPQAIAQFRGDLRATSIYARE